MIDERYVGGFEAGWCAAARWFEDNYPELAGGSEPVESPAEQMRLALPPYVELMRAEPERLRRIAADIKAEFGFN